MVPITETRAGAGMRDTGIFLVKWPARNPTIEAIKRIGSAFVRKNETA